MSQTEEILAQSNVRLTPNRKAVLEIFMQQHKSLSHGRLLGLLENKMDRVSLYRTLMDLVNAGLLFKLMDSEGVAQFHYPQVKACSGNSFEPHFKCKNCEEITALPDLPGSYLQQILSYGQIQKSRLLLEGICFECSRANNPGNQNFRE